MTKILMPYGSAENAPIMSKAARGDAGKIAQLFAEHLKRTERKTQDEPKPDTTATKS